MSDITPEKIKLEEMERKDLKKITLSADGDTSLWMRVGDVYALEITGITADTIEMYATNDSKKATTEGTQVGISIEEDDLIVGDCAYCYVRIEKTGATDDVVLLLSTSEK